jgi:hypothetical protein
VPDKATYRSRVSGAGDTVVGLSCRCRSRVVAHEHVEADRDRIALQRGPIVFAAEWPDNPGGRVRNLVIADDEPLGSEIPADLLGGVAVITGRAVAHAHRVTGARISATHRSRPIPYFAWANRGPRRDGSVDRPQRRVRASDAGADAGHERHGDRLAEPSAARFVNDGEEPTSSDDPALYFDWWPRKGTTEWVEMTLAAKARVSEVDVYWFDDTGHGQVRVPASWRLLHKSSDHWLPVQTSDPYGVARDRYNRVRFTPVETQALRLEVTMQGAWSAGVQEWKVR